MGNKTFENIRNFSGRNTSLYLHNGGRWNDQMFQVQRKNGKQVVVREYIVNPIENQWYFHTTTYGISIYVMDTRSDVLHEVFSKWSTETYKEWYENGQLGQ